ncbi:hypothetical protein K8D14_22770, partial [Enterobacter kobei]|nr:hypothetical protein [Enterobacter kobei]
SVGMVLANRCHRQNMKTSIINGSEVSRLSVAIQNLAAVSRALDVSYSHLRQLIFKGMSVSDALNYLVNEKKGVNNHA